ncbi:MAG: hypothetical protein AB1401_00830 [Thermodesulfobacteriota bacterium]
MRIGRKSLLFGCHQFILHPIFVLIAWIRLYGWPRNKWIYVGILIHDWGYWFSSGYNSVFDSDFDIHTVWAYSKLLSQDRKAAEECLYHSRFLAIQRKKTPSRLCWADKMASAIMPSWLWALLAWLSGEGDIYRNNRKYETYRDEKISLKEWHKEYAKFILPVVEKNGGRQNVWSKEVL